MNFCTLGLAVIETEAQAVFELTQRIDSRFEKACELLLACKGRIVVTGMGKSGHIGRKIAATLASTGTPALYTVVGGSGQIVYGYFILDTNSGLYLAAEKFSTAWNPSSGGSFAIVPVWNILDS